MAETWTSIDNPTAFQDDAVFEIDKTTKNIQVLVEQPIVAGENKSQFIKFQMGRYYDAIDLTQMEVNILYESPTGYQDISTAVNREYSDEYIRFGWLVPYAACPVKGTLGFAVEFVGADYALKTTRGETPVLDSISGSSSVPEPTEQTWYIELQSQVASSLQTALDALEKSQQIINALATPWNASLVSEMSDTSAVYVYTGSESGYIFGNWYYHNGTEWVSGGKYASTDYLIDPTLTQSGQAADALETGGNFERLNNISVFGNDNTFPVQWFERGSITQGANDNYRPGSRARTKNILQFDSMCFVSVTTGYYLVAYYDSSGTWTSNSGWKTTEVLLIPKNQKFRILVTPNNSAAASVTYTLPKMVANLRVAIDSAQKQTKGLFSISFEHGSLSQGADDTYNQAGRCRSGVCMFPFSINVSMLSGSYAIHFLDDNGQWTHSATWRTTDKYQINAYQKFRLLLAENTTSSAYADLSTMVDNLQIEVVQTDAPFSASPNIIWQCRDVDDTHIPPFTKWYVKSAANNQYDRVRCNVRVTTDGYLFLCHDDTINNVARNTDGSAIAETINTNGQTLATLNSYDWGILYGSKYAGATVPMFEDFCKWAAMYNLGVTWHSATSLVETDALLEEQFEILDKYGLMDNLIVITSGGQRFSTMEKFKAHNPRVSYYIGGNPEFFRSADNIASIKALQTAYNKIYVQLYPWGTYPTAELIEIAKANNFLLYNSIPMSKAELLDETQFEYGFSLIECANVYRVKDTVRNWVDGLIT